MTIDNDTVGKRILDCRTANDISQSKLAELTGVSTAAIWQWETRGRIPRAGTLRKIADVLNVSPSYLLTGKARGDETATREVSVERGAPVIETGISVAQQIEKLKAAIAQANKIDAANIKIEIKISS
jgi:HTH-type transcriptional regulator, cell division transcriptional repressor